MSQALIRREALAVLVDNGRTVAAALTLMSRTGAATPNDVARLNALLSALAIAAPLVDPEPGGMFGRGGRVD